ncbi:MAG: hypothetical protein LUE27_09590 [Clostridia bacterium]|nr:hypothetical protein [Clostridia bacterium]
MAGIIERNARDTAVIRRRAGIEDGKPVWSEEECLCFPMDFEQSDRDWLGAIESGKVFLVAPMGEAPGLPGMVVYNGEEYDIRGVRTYRNLRGELLGYRVAVAGAS